MGIKIMKDNLIEIYWEEGKFHYNSNRDLISRLSRNEFKELHEYYFNLWHEIEEEDYHPVCTCQFKEASKHLKVVHNKNCPLSKV